MTQELRDALDAEAARTGRSLSQVAELWLEDARRGRASAESYLGGDDVAPALKRMAQVAADIVEEIGSPSESFAARQVVLAVWSSLASQMLPTPIDVEANRILGLQIAAERRLVELGWPDSFLGPEVNSKVWSDYQVRFDELNEDGSLSLDVKAQDVIERLYKAENPQVYAVLVDYFNAESELERRAQVQAMEFDRQKALAGRIVEALARR